MTIGEILTEIRESRDLSQTELAEALDITPQYISNVERDVNVRPVSYVKKIWDRLTIKEKGRIQKILGEIHDVD